ncbi:MAG: amidohydrolase [Algicola sp.]|nr:amidohydrolase [Algicola sp.]
MRKSTFALFAASLFQMGCTTTATTTDTQTGATAMQAQEAKQPPSSTDALAPRLSGNPRTLDMFKKGYEGCYDRASESYAFVVDSHNHFRPFGGNAIPLYQMSDYLRRLGVLFVNIYGIGQTLPIDSGCEYYLDCQGTDVIPTIKNDFRNASNVLEYEPEGVHMTLSMSFPNLAKPALVEPQIKLLDREYPKQFKWMGEVNLVKQALFGNNHKATTEAQIGQWGPFMKILEERKIPIAIHSDLGCSEKVNEDDFECGAGERTKYLHLMDKVLELYGDTNKIVWVHMGLSKELTDIPPAEHIDILKERLDKYPNLNLDITWGVIWDYYFSDSIKRPDYVNFLNEYSTRILPGTDFVALHTKDYLSYAKEVQKTSQINLYLDDNAFRNIALGENYFRLFDDMGDLGDMSAYTAPKICEVPAN